MATQHQTPAAKPSASRRTEVRNLNPQDAKMLGHILETLDGWQTLMEAIPRAQSSQTTFEDTHDLKYTYNDVCQIKEASVANKQHNATQILFDEWGTSGRIRPNLDHLLQLLVQLQLFRAADFLAVDILKENTPDRPAAGIAARVDITLPQRPPPQSETADPGPSPTPQHDAPTPPALLVHIADQPPTADGPNMNRTATKEGPSHMQKVNVYLSDFIKFSKSQLARADADEESSDNSEADELDRDLPAPSSLYQPNLSLLQAVDSSPPTAGTTNVPDLPMLMQSSGLNKPDLTILQGSAANSDVALPDVSAMVVADDDYVPAFSALNIGGATQSSLQIESLADTPLLSQLQGRESDTVAAGAEAAASTFNVPELSGMFVGVRDGIGGEKSAETADASTDFNVPDISGLIPVASSGGDVVVVGNLSASTEGNVPDLSALVGQST